MTRFKPSISFSMICISMLTVVPFLVLLASWFDPQLEIWSHLYSYVLKSVIKNTFILSFCVAFFVSVIGISLAWITAIYRFPGCSFFSWALILPLAIPSYVLATVKVGLYDYSGPIQIFLRTIFGEDLLLPSIRSIWGAVVVFSLVLYPYVYVLTRQAFSSQGTRCIEVSQTLGFSRVRSFFKLILPMSRPWWIAGITLALMELLADFGTVSIFSIDTFTTAIYKSWIGFFNFSVASQLASLLAIFVLVILLIEQRGREKRKFNSIGGKIKLKTHEKIKLKGFKSIFAFSWCALIFLFAFAIPLFQLTFWAIKAIPQDLNLKYFNYIYNSLILSIISSLFVVTIGFWMAYIKRNDNSLFTSVITRISTIGYAFPGMVLSVGVFIPIAWLDIKIGSVLNFFNINNFSLIKGSIFVMLLAIISRFLVLGFEPINSSMQRISISQEQAARCLGFNKFQVFRNLFLPMLKSGWIGAGLLVFVEVMKEMPITLMMRPFGWDTLAVRVFEMSSEGMWERAALPSVAIVLTGLIPLIFFQREMEK